MTPGLLEYDRRTVLAIICLGVELGRRLGRLARWYLARLTTGLRDTWWLEHGPEWPVDDIRVRYKDHNQ